MAIWRTQTRVYLDAAAAAPVRPEARAAFVDALAHFGNPSSPHAEGRAARAVLDQARTQIARLAEVKPDAVIFTGNATEANALLMRGVVAARRAAGVASPHVLYMAGSHSSVTHTIERLVRDGVVCEAIPLTDGALDLKILTSLIRPETVLVVVDGVCGETGARYAVRDVRRVLDAAHAHAVLHVDGSQMPLSNPFELTRLGADSLSLDAQKVGGVRGVGALIAPRRVTLTPLMDGGGQERGVRPGTEATALIAAFAEALIRAHAERGTFLAASLKTRTMLMDAIAAIPNAYVNEGRDQDPHILNVSFVGRDTDYLVALLDEAGFAVSTRSACETDAKGSRAVLALIADEARAQSTVRISWASPVSQADTKRFIDALMRAVNFLDTAGIL